MADVDDADAPLDPRIQIELENLNSATDDINKLEIELDEANSTFKQLLSESTKQLEEFVNKLGHSCIEKARCYYEASEVARQAQIQCQHQAHLYQRASEIHAAAKETVALAEARFISHRHEWNFDQAWQDMLNHATIKVMDAENQKAECGREHHRKAVLFHDADKKAQQLEEKYRRAIIKARPYFEVRANCEQKLAQQKEKVQCLEKAVKEAKRAYAESFQALEKISNEIHQQRRELSIMVNGPREPGVGAELITPDGSLDYKDELNRVTAGRLDSLTSETDSDERARDIEDVNELKDRMENLSARSVDGSESTSSQWELELQSVLAINNYSKSLTSSPVNAYSFNNKKDNLSSNNNNNNNNNDINEPTESINELSDNQNNLDNNANGLNNESKDNVPSNVFTNNSDVSSTRESEKDSHVQAQFVESPKKREPTCKISSVKELPLLSIFNRSSSLRMSRDRSCSMVNLDDKNNIKSILDNTDLKNIQAVSVERLACARNILMSDK
ncbi:SH3 domain-binding protein 5 homolog [Cotesia glomerata]|uniref:SH3 domain-binding protein 5 homolog n=1 Tax=Cotesia glomerata TaxID=32391 RepID=A0AAV7IJL8_COTGL|nr:SH3 domain-binding protein 5 homolog [Cotesia glomerata]KAH0552629.1 hypothetical protein KQX54_013463 [Cotesia glomerata]